MLTFQGLLPGYVPAPFLHPGRKFGQASKGCHIFFFFFFFIVLQITLKCILAVENFKLCPSSSFSIFYLKSKRGAPRCLSWLSVHLLISAQVMIPLFVTSSPSWGSALRAWSLLGILSSSFSAPPLLVFSHLLSFSKMNYILFFFFLSSRVVWG